MNCPNCGKEILYEDATFCPKCGESLAPEDEIQQKRTDLVLAAAMLTIISAAFSAGLGYLAFDRYVSFFGYSFSLVLGFLIVGVLSTVVSAFGIAGGIFMLKRKYVNFSMLGVILLLVSAFGDYITLQYYRRQYSLQYGFMEIALFSAILIIIFSILSGIFVAKSKAEFN
ncbi:MAG: zinc ribbon domain-containing protein [Candidatus Bathyarchaeota archaeon]|nr:zinc ribbon domain-containing protein [Candidatus Bathyarchaeota archaeon]